MFDASGAVEFKGAFLLPCPLLRNSESQAVNGLSFETLLTRLVAVQSLWLRQGQGNLKNQRSKNQNRGFQKYEGTKNRVKIKNPVAMPGLWIIGMNNQGNLEGAIGTG